MLRWNASAVRKRIADGMAAGMEQAGRIIVDSERRLISTPAPPPAPVGSPPHRRTGHLRDAQAYKVERRALGPVLVIQAAKPGSEAAAYAGFVARRRPWLRKGVLAVRGDIVRSVAQGVSGALGGSGRGR